jgi:hypothetical protein
VRIESALQASAHHYQRTGRCFYITAAIVQSAGSFEELEDDEHFRDRALLLPPGINLRQLYHEHLRHMNEIARYTSRASQRSSQCTTQTPSQHNPNPQHYFIRPADTLINNLDTGQPRPNPQPNVIRPTDTLINNLDTGQPRQSSQSQGNSSRVPEVGQVGHNRPNSQNHINRHMRNPSNISDLADDDSYQSWFVRRMSPSFDKDISSVSRLAFASDPRLRVKPFETCHISQLHTEGIHSESLIQHIDEIFKSESISLFPWNIILRRPTSSQDTVAMDEWWNIEAGRNPMDNAIINTEVIDYAEDGDRSRVFIFQDE